MYDATPATNLRPRTAAIAVLAAMLAVSGASAQVLQSGANLIRKISNPSEKLELTVNSSRILTLETRIPRVQVNNPDLLSVTALSATQIQVSAKKAGVTAVNLWDEDGQIHTVDVFIYGDVRELEHALQTQFPNSSVRVYRYSNSLVLTGFIDRPDYVTPIVELAQDYSPKIINNMSVGGVQQILLKVKVYEVSRTKLRDIGADWATNGTNGLVGSSVSDVLSNLTSTTITHGGMGGETGDIVRFGVLNGSDQFVAFVRALQQHNMAKILAEPNIVAVSGRPAQFNEGGEFPILVPQSLGTASIEFKKFGTQVDFLPIVLGNGNIRLEVRPRVSSLDPASGIQLSGTTVPGLVVREVDTAVEMKAGQTFALAGLIQRRTEASNRGWPILASMPGIGIPFRRVQEEVNEIELLIMVTPEFIDPMNPDEVPRCYPGAGTMSPTDKELYWDGHIEVPNMCNPCGGYPCVPTHGHEPCCPDGSCGLGGCSTCGDGSCGSGFDVPIQAYEQPYQYQAPYGAHYEPVPYSEEMAPTPVELPAPMPSQRHGELTLPPDAGASVPVDRVQGPAIGQGGRAMSDLSQRPAPHFTASRNPQYQRQASQPFNRQAKPDSAGPAAGSGGLIGPVGYDLD